MVAPMNGTIAIVGAGQAAAVAVEALRKEGFDGRLVVVGDEPHLPYQRPPLSKKFLAGEMPVDRLLIRPAAFFETARAEMKLGVRAEGIDLHHRTVRLSDGDALNYDSLLLATGTAPRKVTVPGHDLEGVHYLRTIADVDRLRAELATAKNVVVVGAGYIGLEVAATCRKLGLDVDVLEMADRPMNRVVAPEVSAFFAAEHAKEGVRIHTQTLVSGFEPRAGAASRVGAVHTLDGRSFAADVVIVGIGVVPVTGLAAAAGLAVENGIAIDEHCRTSDPHVWAAGDCTNHPSPRYHRRVRLESVDNAFEQAKSAAANMLGRTVVHDKVPWFWSDQFDLKLLIVGLNFDYDRALLRGDPATRAFSCCYLRGGELLAIDCVNNAKDYMAAKKLIAERATFDVAKLADAAIALKDCVAG
jgi:3-phenylpropionate/trans-cinnamate dioxygenase ferredoxin reductase subunit